MSQSLENKTIARIYGHSRGWAFSQKDFSDIGGRSSIDWVLYNLEGKGTIRRVIRGIYDYPRTGKLIKGKLGPEIQEVAQAIARKHGWTIQPSGETALNVFELSTQVPGRYLFFSDGPNRSYMVENLSLEFRKGPLKDIRIRSNEGILLVQALKALGKEQIGKKTIAALRDKISPKNREKIVKETKYVTDWIYDAIKKICL